MGVMWIVLGLLAILLSLVAILSYQWVSIAPQLGIRILYHLRTIRIAVAATAITLAVMAKRRAPAGRGWAVLGTVLALTPLSGALHAAKVIVPLDQPDHVEAAAATIDDDAMVLGVERDGRAHAWLVRTLVPHHLVHDTIDGRPVVAAWCEVCHSGIVFDGTVDGQALHFDPEAVWRRNMIMRDRETGTLWQHSTGEALVGPLAGTHLAGLGGRLMTWGAWRAEHPDTTLTSDTTAAAWPGLLPKDVTVRLLTEAGGGRYASWGLGGLTPNDDRLDFRAEVIGVEIDGQAKAYPIETLETQGTVEDEVAGVPVTISFDPTGSRADVAVDGQSGSFKRTRWLDWFEFHPETVVYE